MFEHNRFQRAFLITATLSILASLSGCDNAYVSCGNVAKLQTNMGLINSEGVVLGNLILLDPTNPSHYTASYASELKNFDKDKDVTINPDSDTAEMDTSSGLDISFSMSLTPAESATLSTQLSNSVQLKLKNSNRHQIKLPAEVINRPDNASVVSGYIRTGHHLVLVVAGNTSESAEFVTKNSASNQLKLAIPGKSFNVQVNYQCQGALSETVAKDRTANALTFFKVVEIVKADDRSYTTQDLADALNKYDLSNAAQERPTAKSN
jgi:hypothetical protein